MKKFSVCLRSSLQSVDGVYVEYTSPMLSFPAILAILE